MAKLILNKASTDITVYCFIQDSSKTTGEGLTGLAYNTASLVASYVRPLSSRQAITLATLAAVDSAHSDGGFIEIDATNMPGLYRLDLPDAVCATGVNSTVVMLSGAADMAPVLLEIQLSDFDLNDNTEIAAIKAKTDQLTFSIANKVDATASAVIDEAAISDIVLHDIWSYRTRTLTNQGVEATYPAEGDPLIIYRDTTVTISLTGLGDSTGDAGTKIFFTAKENLEDADTSSILQLVCTRADPITDPDTDDLLYVNKVAPTAADKGTFVFTDHADGTAVVTIAGSAAAYLPIYAATPLYWDVKMVTAAGVSTILSTGSMYIYGTPTRTIA